MRPSDCHPCLTQKGKGFEAALKFPEKFHGLGSYDAKTGETPATKPGTPPMYQDVMGQTMVKLCQKNNTLVSITAAMPTSLKHEAFAEKAMPDRYVARHRRGTCRDFRGGNGDDGFHPVCAVIPRFSSAPTIASIMTFACRIAGDFLHGSRRAFPRTTARRITACSTSRICAVFQM